MALHKVFDKETGEFISNIKYDSKADEFKQINTLQMNTIYSSDESGNIEIVYYRRPFLVPEHVAMDNEIISDYMTDHEMQTVVRQRRQHITDIYGYTEESESIQRNFERLDGKAKPLRPDVTIQDLLATMYRGGKRAKKNFYDYALSNEWEYFCTYTFADEQCRHDLTALQNTWKKFTRSIRCKYPDVKIIAVPERGDRGERSYHMHALMANCDLTLVPKRHDKTGKFLFSDYGHPRMIAKDWNNGWCEVTMINPESSQVQVVNYLTKYFTKSFDMPFGAKRYYMTRNLTCRDRYIDFFNEIEIDAQCMSLGLTQYKDNDSFVVYRNF